MPDATAIERDRVNIIARMMLDALIEHRSDQASIIQLINRALMLIQTPVCLAIFSSTPQSDAAPRKRTRSRRNPAQTGYLFRIHTVRDYHYAHHFKSMLQGVLQEGNLLDANYHEHLIALADSEGISYRALVFGVRPSIQTSKTEFGAEFNILDRSQHRLRMLEAAFRRLAELAKDVDVDLGAYFSHSGEKMFEASKFRELKSYPSSLSEATRSVCEICLDEVREIIEDEYRTFSSSPLLSSDLKYPSNIFFFVKTFDRDRARYNDDYHYNVRWLIPKAQQEEFAHVLRACRHSKKTRATWELPVFQRRISSEDGKPLSALGSAPHRFETKPRYPVGELDRIFWDAIRTDDGIAKLLTLVSEPYGDESRSFVDPCLASGVVQFRTKVFGPDSFINTLGDRNEETRRRVFMHYLFAILSPRSATRELSTLVAPIRVDGAPWMSTGTVLSAAERPFPDVNGALVDDRYFSHNFSFYFTLAEAITRNIRHKSRQKYREVINISIQAALRSSGDKKDLDHSYFISEVNRQLRCITRVFPYRQALISKVPVKGYFPSGDDFDCRFIDNAWYDRVRIPPTLSPEFIRGALEEAINADLKPRANS